MLFPPFPMVEKLLMPALFLAAQFLVSWYGWYTGKLSSSGSFLGFQYDSPLVRSIVTQLEFLWLLVIINALFSFGFHLGFSNYKNFIVIAALWIASGPIAALLFNMIVAKQGIDWPILLGLALIAAGAVLVVAHADVKALLR